MNYLKKDGSLCAKAIEVIKRLQNGKYRKLSDFYNSRTTNYASILDSDLFLQATDKAEIKNAGFSPLTKRMIKIDLNNKYVVACVNELKNAEELRKLKEIEAVKTFEKMKSLAMDFINNNPELVENLKAKHPSNSRGLQIVAWKLSNRANDKGFKISKTAFYHVL